MLHNVTGLVAKNGAEVVVNVTSGVGPNLTALAKACGLELVTVAADSVLKKVCSSSTATVLQVVNNTITALDYPYVPTPETALQCVEQAVCGTSSSVYYILGGTLTLFAAGALYGLKKCQSSQKDESEKDVEKDATEMESDPFNKVTPGSGYGTAL